MRHTQIIDQKNKWQTLTERYTNQHISLEMKKLKKNPIIAIPRISRDPSNPPSHFQQ